MPERQTSPSTLPPRRHWLRTFFRRLFLVLGVITFASLVIGIIAGIKVMHSQTPPLPGTFVLSMKLDADYPEYLPLDNPFGVNSPTFIDVIDALDHAAKDNRVKGIVVDLEDAPLGVDHLQELRDALLRFRKAGKFADIYSPSYGQPGRGLGTYYFASAFDEIWMQPVGTLSIAGISAEMPYGRQLLDKYNVQPQFFQRKEYKSLFESFNNDHMSPKSKEEMTSLINDLGTQFMTGIEQAKGIKPAALQGIVNQGLFTDQEAVTANLVTKLDGFDALKDKVANDVTGTPDTGKKDLHKLIAAKKDDQKKIDNGKLFVDMDRYAAETQKDLAKDSHRRNVAVIYINGAISDASESSRAVPAPRVGFGDQFTPAADPIDALIAAADDPSIAIIVLRIDSPGGSPSASETIRRAVVRAEGKGKKVVISMGDECASGGYWIASAGSHIFAEPGTLTGSIGVAGGKFNLAGLWNKFGINWDGVSYGPTADMFSFNHPFTPAETARINDMMDSIYAGFVARVAEGRHMTVAEAETVARGRVWTGRQARANGLVDDLGGLGAALDYAAQQVGLQNRTQLHRETFPKPQSPIDKLEDLAGQVRSVTPLETQLAPVLQQLQQAAMAGRYLTYDPLVVH